MKIWFDILTPKQLLFFESMVKRLEKNHTVLCTSRNYRELNALTKIRKQKLVVMGSHGGITLPGKLHSSLTRMNLLFKKIRKYSPDVCISFCSPDASRIAFGLNIPHIGFSNSPHSDAVMKLSIPYLFKLLIPIHINKQHFTKFGISKHDIITYDAMDEYLIVKNQSIPSRIPIIKKRNKKMILFRTYEYQASYIKKKIDIVELINTISTSIEDSQIIVLARYDEEIKKLKKLLKKDITILDRIFDSKQILCLCDVFVGSGGTMTSEAALRGIPTISYNAIPNSEEKFLLKNKMIQRSTNPQDLVSKINNLLNQNKTVIRRHANDFMNTMEDPYDRLLQVMHTLNK